MKIIGTLVKDALLIDRARDIGRLYQKSHFGKILGNCLRLNLLEGVFLKGEKKITVVENNKEIGFNKLVQKAAKTIPRFEIRYLVFRDLRKRGLFVTLSEHDAPYDFTLLKRGERTNGQCLIYVFSERDTIKIMSIQHFAENAKKHQLTLWIAIVDEEGDITYYEVSKIDPQGTVDKYCFSKIHGILLEHRVVIFDMASVNSLFSEEFFGKPFGNGLQLSLIEAMYLVENKVLKIVDISGNHINKKLFKSHVKRTYPDVSARLRVFTDLKQRNLIVKTGFKFGTHFRVYTQKPDVTHAEYLVHVVDANYSGLWAEISRAVRLAHSVNKEIVFALIDKNSISYLKFGRLRP